MRAYMFIRMCTYMHAQRDMQHAACIRGVSHVAREAPDAACRVYLSTYGKWHVRGDCTSFAQLSLCMKRLASSWPSNTCQRDGIRPFNEARQGWLGTNSTSVRVPRASSGPSDRDSADLIGVMLDGELAMRGLDRGGRSIDWHAEQLGSLSGRVAEGRAHL